VGKIFRKNSIDERGRNANKIYKKVIDYNRCSPQDWKIPGGQDSFSYGHDEGGETGFRNPQPGLAKKSPKIMCESAGKILTRIRAYDKRKDDSSVVV
jgi:hypothetical protein